MCVITFCLVLIVSCQQFFYRAMHFSAFARSWDRISSVCLSVTLVSCDHCDHIGWNSWKIISRLISIGFLLSVDPISWIHSEWNISKMGRIRDFGTFPTPIKLWYLFNVIIFMGMIQPCRCLFILVADYLFQSIVSVVGLVLRVRFDSLQTTTTKHLYIFRHFAGH